MNVAAQLLATTKEAGLTVAVAARILGVSRAALYAWAKGETAISDIRKYHMEELDKVLRSMLVDHTLPADEIDLLIAGLVHKSECRP